MTELGSVKDVRREALAVAEPPPKLSLSEWADEHFYLSAESAAEPGRWKTLPYQKGIMDAFTDPTVTHISVMKSARVGWTKIVNALIGYSIHQDPCPILVVQPTVDDAKGYSKEEIAPMLRDCPALSAIVIEDAEEVGARDSGNTILHKRYPGGVMSLVGANSGAGLRRVSRKRVLFDEVDAYPPSAGSEGDPVKLGTKRTDYYWDRKIGAGSTPLIAGASRIEKLFLAGDQRYFFVPCPHCGHFDRLVFTGPQELGGHYMQWPEGKPEEAFFVCSLNGCVIDHKHKREMITAGQWRASSPFVDHASFHIWAAYSFSPNATWGQLALEFEAAKKDGPLTLQTFVNTVLGETWKVAGEAPEWERLYQRREDYKIGTVPAGVKFLTVGVDVQKDRFVYEVVGWAPGVESWSIDAGVIPCDPADDASWLLLDELLERQYPTTAGPMVARCLAVDSGYNTQEVYNWGRRHDRQRVLAVKGWSGARTILGIPSAVDVLHNGKRFARGYRMWLVGSDIAKSELYGRLRLQPPTEPGRPFPRGFCHFPGHEAEFFKQLTSEQLVTISHKRTGRQTQEWQVIAGRQNHWLDCRVYARAAAAFLGVDRMPMPKIDPAALAKMTAELPAPASPPGENRISPDGQVFEVSDDPKQAELERRLSRPAAPAPSPESERVRTKPSDSRLSFLRPRGKRWLSR